MFNLIPKLIYLLHDNILYAVGLLLYFEKSVVKKYRKYAKHYNKYQVFCKRKFRGG